ncbi:MAG TPA: reverse transcriptase-like protein [Synergistales bacterium]|nr:reverse transcriptase-like protein [Synergistales bacterium]
MTWHAYFDGASRGNPGPACAACVIFNEKREVLWERSEFLGEKTNNEAEYAALILLLEEIRKRRPSRVYIHGDSKLVINQVKGLWKVNKPHLMELLETIRTLAEGLSLSFSWVPRSENGHADSLCNRELDRRGSRQSSTFEISSLEKVAENIYIAHGTEDYAIDLAHGACTCPAFRRNGDCKHIRAVRQKADGADGDS